MISLFVLFAMNFSTPYINAHDAFKTSCENGKEYVFYEAVNFYLNMSTVVDKEGNTIYSGNISPKDRKKLKHFYCIENELYTLVADKGDESPDVEELNIYKLTDDGFIEQDSIERTHAFNPVIKGDMLIYYSYQDKYLYKVRMSSTFGIKEQYLYIPMYKLLKQPIYLEETDSFLHLSKNDYLTLYSPISKRVVFNEEISSLYDAKIFNGTLYFLVKATNNKVMIVDEYGSKYHEYSVEGQNFFTNGVLVVNDYGLYALVLRDNRALKLIVTPHFDSSKNNATELSSNALNIRNYESEYYYMENSSQTTYINSVSGNCTKPNAPEILSNIIGVQENKPSSFRYSNFSEDPSCFKSFDIEISFNERFTRLEYSDSSDYYNENSSDQTYQFLDSFIFEENKPYYIRLKYNNILTSSDFSYARLIITNLGEITKFEISDTSSNSKLYTNEEVVNIKLEKLGELDKIQISLNQEFKDENGDDVSSLDFNSDFNFLLPEEEKEYIYYLRPVSIDNSNNNIIGGGGVKEAIILLDKTAPEIPKIKTQDEVFFSDSIKIEWEFSTDNLSGVDKYSLRLVDSLNNNIETASKTSTENFYTPSELLNNGIYTLFISVCDKSENCSLEAKTNFTVKESINLKPYRPSIEKPKNEDIIEEMPFEISWSKPSDPENDELSYSLIISENSDFSQPEIELSLIKNTFTDIEYLSEGHYYLKLFAVDSYGNASSYEIIEFDVIEPGRTSNSSGCSF